MHIIRDLKHIGDEYKGNVLALGNFDGMHLGHQAILREAVALANAHNTTPMVMSFAPHPREFFSKNDTQHCIYSLRQKIDAIRDCGIERVILMRFNKQLASTSAADFVQHILHDILAVKHVVTGYNFAFGKNRQGDCLFLTEKAQALNFGFTAHPQVMLEDGGTISTSALRGLLSEGRVKQAATLLGKPYSICGHVVHGEKRGRELGFPTINLSLKKRFRPRYGIYACRVRFSGETKAYDAVASLGVRPTFNHTEPLLEAHCFDMNHEVYGKLAHVELVEFIRDEVKFENVVALEKQMHEDAKQAKSLLS